MPTEEPMHEVTMFLVDPDPLTIPVAVMVKVHPSVALLNEWRDANGMADHGGEEQFDSGALTEFTWDEDAENDTPFVMHLAADQMELAHVVHECTHIALWWYWTTVLEQIPNARAVAHIGHHDESIPEMVGNLSALIWYQLATTGLRERETD